MRVSGHDRGQDGIRTGRCRRVNRGRINGLIRGSRAGMAGPNPAPDHARSRPRDGIGTDAGRPANRHARRHGFAGLRPRIPNSLVRSGTAPADRTRRSSPARGSSDRSALRRSECVESHSLFPEQAGLTQHRQEIALHARQMFSDNRPACDQHHGDGLTQVVLVQPERFPQQPSCPASNRGGPDFSTRHDTEARHRSGAEGKPIGNQTARHVALAPPSGVDEIAPRLDAHRPGQPQ